MCVIHNIQLNRLNLPFIPLEKMFHFFNFDLKWTATVLSREIFSAENPGGLWSIIKEKKREMGKRYSE